MIEMSFSVGVEIWKMIGYPIVSIMAYPLRCVQHLSDFQNYFNTMLIKITGCGLLRIDIKKKDIHVCLTISININPKIRSAKPNITNEEERIFLQ
jgi:hypothetical protein